MKVGVVPVVKKVTSVSFDLSESIISLNDLHYQVLSHLKRPRVTGNAWQTVAFQAWDLRVYRLDAQ
jgi:hypothetical protein